MNDFVNGAFIVAYAGFAWHNVVALWRAGEVRGTSIGMFVFFAVWGAWQLYYYAALWQWWSVAGTALAWAPNLVWVGLAVYWRRHRNT